MKSGDKAPNSYIIRLKFTNSVPLNYGLLTLICVGGGSCDVLYECLPQSHTLRYDVEKFPMRLLSGTLCNYVI
jgi:hypothetical protein